MIKSDFFDWEKSLTEFTYLLKSTKMDLIWYPTQRKYQHKTKYWTININACFWEFAMFAANLNPNPRARKAYLTRNRASNNVVATPGFDPPTSRTPVPWTNRPSHRVSPPGPRFGGHLSVPVMTQSHLMHFRSSILRRSRLLGLRQENLLSLIFNREFYYGAGMLDAIMLA